MLNCPHCLTTATAAITRVNRRGNSVEQVYCPECKKAYKSSATIKQLVVTRHPSPAEALEALEMLS